MVVAMSWSNYIWVFGRAGNGGAPVRWGTLGGSADVVFGGGGCLRDGNGGGARATGGDGAALVTTLLLGLDTFGFVFTSKS